MAVEGGRSVQQSLAILRELTDTVTSANKSWIRGEMCQINRRETVEKLAELQQCLPEAINAADGIVEQEEGILAAARAEAAEAIAAAKAEAEQLAAEAKRSYEAAQEQIRQAQAEADQIRRDGERMGEQMSQQAEAQAQSIVEDGRRQAQKIVDDAEAEAQRMTSQESILQRAQLAAQELTDETNHQMAQLRQKTFAYLDDMLSKGENYVGSLVQEVHQERENLNSMR